MDYDITSDSNMDYDITSDSNIYAEVDSGGGVVPVVETWELINTADFSDTETNSVEFLKDSNGNEFSLSKFRLVYKLNAGNYINNGIVSVNNLPQNRHIGNGVCVNYYYNTTNHPCVFETVQSIDKIGTISFNAYGGGVAWKQSQNILFGLPTLKHFAPFYRVYTSWTTATTGTVELWGIK